MSICLFNCLFFLYDFQAICGYRETERKHWSEESKKILKRVQQVAFPPGEPILPFVHVLDLQKTGYIKAHIDSVRVHLIYIYHSWMILTFQDHLLGLINW